MTDHQDQAYRAGYRQATVDAMPAAVVADTLGVTQQHVNLMTKRTSLPSARQIGRDWVYWPDDVDVLAGRPNKRRSAPLTPPEHLAYAPPGLSVFASVDPYSPVETIVKPMTADDIRALATSYGLTADDLDRIVTESTGEDSDAIGWMTGETSPSIRQVWVLQHLPTLGYRSRSRRLSSAIDQIMDLLSYELPPPEREALNAAVAILEGQVKTIAGSESRW